MRVSEILNEGITFGVGRLGDHNGQKYYSDPFSKEVNVTCFVCDGVGTEEFGGYDDQDGKHIPKYRHECRMCNGKGTNTEWKSDADELSVSNSNAFAILDMLGIDEPDYSGSIKKETFPELKRQLIKLKNTDFSQHTQAPTKDVGRMRSYTDDSGQSSIGRGPTMYDAGRSHSQVERYIDKLLSLMDFAQKNDCDLVWG